MTLFFILTPRVAGAATVFVLNNGYDTTKGFPGVGSVYYKCNTSVTWPDCDTDVVQMSYSHTMGGSGTMADPYLIWNCSFVGCACGREYVLLSDNTCSQCPGGLAAISPDDTSKYHTISGTLSAKCKYCVKSNQLIIIPYINTVRCIDCPEHGTCENTHTLVCDKGYYGEYINTSGGTCTMCPSNGGIPAETEDSGATDVTECYQPKGRSFYEASGQGKWTNDCYYTK